MAAQDRKATLPIHFFKIILKTNLQRIKLPNEFTRIYGGCLSNPVFLKPPYGPIWEVHWTKENGNEFWLENGWRQFAENYSLDYGCLVVFKYEGSSKFDVLILEQSALEIDYNNLDQGDDESVQILGEWPDQKPKQKSLLLSPQPHRKMRGENSGAQRSSLSLNWPRGARAQEVAETFISNNPFFTATISHRDLVDHTKYVPDLEGYIENIDKYVKLQIGERSWDVKFLRRHLRNNGRCFSAGWSLFVRENDLQKEDVCVFELINREDPVFEVHVFKCLN